ncbi:MAG: tRNA uridine-5-carboxymethylaminomethyl(34) synthesis GTPase MnmE [Oscillospiraceae bacterium]|nr:tRNA uridine-5-carboxymethylaminomethyl(34) synthesis GTPase MnmE [Oscillospiraceae bacterium]
MTTIAAIATAAGQAGIGVIRISGPQAIAVAGRIFRLIRCADPSANKLEQLPGYQAAYGRVYDSDGEFDSAVAVVFRGPHSFTGEDVVEISCHGGRYLLNRCLAAAVAAGAVPAEAGEFTKRAFLGGKLDLAEAEAVMDLISAENRLVSRQALTVLDGVVSSRLNGCKEWLLEIAAAYAAFVDYSDEDVPEPENGPIRLLLQRTLLEIVALTTTFQSNLLFRQGIDTAIIGSPNVGKSTLMNLLSGFPRSIVTDRPGTTRDVVEQTVLVGDLLLRLADTAGIRDTADEVEHIGVSLARERMQSAALVLAVFDGSRPADDNDLKLIDELADCPAVAVVNKTDRPLEFSLSLLPDRLPYVLFSAKTGEGMDALSDAICCICNISLPSAENIPALITQRQYAAALRCQTALEDALSALDSGLALDAVMTACDEAMAAILELTGERVTEAVVDEVFARFCVGK